MSEKIVHWLKGYNSNYLNSSDLPPGKDLVLTVTHVTQEMAKTADAKVKNFLHFKEAGFKPLLLNKENGKTAKRLAGGSNNILEWKNFKVALYIKPNVEAFGEKVDAIRIRPISPATVKVDNKAALATLNACKTVGELGTAYSKLSPELKGDKTVIDLKDKLKTSLPGEVVAVDKKPEDASTQGN